MATYQESTSGTLPFYNEYINKLLTLGGDLRLDQSGQTVPTQTLAGFSPLQQQAFDLTKQSVGSYQPFLDLSKQAITSSQTGAQFDPTKFQQFFNPYLSGVVDEIGRIGTQQFTESIAPTISSNYSGLGQFGSARQGMALAEAGGRSQREILGQQAQALNTGYNTAMGNYLDWSKLGVGANQTAGNQFGNLAQVTQQLGLGDIGALSTAGLTQQQQAQKEADLPFLNWQQQQAYPWQQLNNWANLFKAGTPQQTSSWNASFKRGGLATIEDYAGGGDFDDDNGMAAATLNRVPMLNFLLSQNQTYPTHPSELYEAVKSSPAFSPVEPGPVTERIGKAMLRAGAQGPANWGQLIGRSGSEYFGELDTIEKENFAREVQKDKLLSEISKYSVIKNNALTLSKFGKMAVEMGYIPGTPEFNEKVEELMRTGKPGELSTLGKIARDEGLEPGTPEFGRRVSELRNLEDDVRVRGVKARESTAGTYAGNLGARKSELETKYGPMPGATPGPGVPAPDSGTPAPTSTITPPTRPPVANLVKSDQENQADIDKIGDPAERKIVQEAYDTQKAEKFSRHPGVLKFVNQGLPIKAAIDRFETEGKEYDKLREEKSKDAEPLSALDFDRALQLNEYIHKSSGPGTGAWYNVPYSTDVMSTIPGQYGEAVGELKALGTKMIPSLTKGLTPVSNADMQAMSKAGFGPELGYATNKATIERAKSVSLLFKEQESFYNAAQEMGLSPAQAKVEWNKYIRENPLFDLKKTTKTGVLQYNIVPEQRLEILDNFINRAKQKFFVGLRQGKFSPSAGATKTEESKPERIMITPDMLED